MYIKIKQNKILYYRWSTEKRKYIGRPCKSLLPYLSCNIQSIDCTLEQLFYLIEKDETLINFISIYSRCPVQDFIDSLKQNKTTETEIECIEVCWRTNLTVNYGGNNFAEPYRHLCGIGFAGSNKNKSDTRERYCISYTPLNEIKHCPVKLNKTVYIYDAADCNKIAYHYNKSFSLLDFLDAIFDDISDHGGPQDNIEFLEKLDRLMDEYEKNKTFKKRKTMD